MRTRLEHHGESRRLDAMLAEYMAEFSREELKEAIREGYVRVEGRTVYKPRFALESGDCVDIDIARFKKSFFQTPTPRGDALRDKVEVLSCYPDFLVVNKPAGLLVHRTHNPHEVSLVEILTEWYPEIQGVGESEGVQDRSGIVHRLDKDTSGILVVARTTRGYRQLKHKFQDRTVDKTYIAIVRGTMNEERGEISARVARSKTDHTRRVIVTDQTSKRHYSGVPREAHTEYEVLQYGTVRDTEVTKIRVWLHTGRTHQIRLHCKHLGHPLLGDKMYGGKWEKHHSSETRHLLHAESLSFEYQGERYDFSSEPPADMELDNL